MNKTVPNPVFMIEGRPVAAGEAILSEASAVDRSKAQSSDRARGRIESSDEALAALVREHSLLVYRIAYAALRRHHDAEDATQETFLRVLRYRAKLADVEDPKTWLARIAWRVAVDRSKRRRADEISIEDETSVLDVASADFIADAQLEGAQLRAILEKLIQALPRKLRQPLILSTLGDMSSREVAAVLGINEAAVRSRVFRARSVLKEKLAQRIGRRG